MVMTVHYYAGSISSNISLLNLKVHLIYYTYQTDMRWLLL